MMKHPTFTLSALSRCLLLTLAVTLPALSQERTQQPAQQKAEIGMPLLRNYTPKEYSAATQVWSILQDRRGVLYFGVSNRVLEYDGVTWRKIRVPGLCRSLALDATGKIWVGGAANFGYLEPDANGTLQYVSLVEMIPPEHRSFNDTWQVLPTPQGIYFRSYVRLFRWDGQRMQVWVSKTSFEALSQVRGRLYTAQTGIGLQEIVGNELRNLPGGDAWKDSRRLFLHAYDDRRILVTARGELLRLYDGEQVIPFSTEADDYLKKNDVYTSVLLPDGGFCLTILGGGAVLIERDGRLRRMIDKDAGLQNQNVLTAYSDREGALWFGLGYGITRVDINSPISLFSRETTGDVVRHGGSLYATSATTGIGLYRLEPNPTTGLVSPQPISSGSRQAFDLLSFQDPTGKALPQLLAATSLGVVKIEGDKVLPALQREEGLPQGGFSLLQSWTTPNRVFAGRSESLSSMRWEGGQWIDEGRVPTNSNVNTMV
ncbi:MAG TPA: hypothetical protein VD994_13480, partial [Prosthecobacter sp.]|nr:hypothetical protein [Prosthecobacter sp.]